MKKVISVILAILLMLSACVLAACGGNDSGKDSGTKTDTQPGGNESTPGGNETTPGGNETDPGSGSSETNPGKYPDAIPEDVKFEGGEVIVLAAGSGWIIEDPEEINEGDSVEMAVYTRQKEVEDRFGIVIETVPTSSTSETNTKWSDDVASGSNAYDIMTGHMRFNGSLALNNNNLNINKLKYVDLSNDYWNPSYCDAWCYKKVQFWVTGDIDKGFLDVMVVTYVNDDIFSRYHPEENLLDVVLDGQWTYAKALEYIDGVYEDTNGSDTVDKGDLIGWVFQNGWSVSSLAYSGGFQISSLEGSKHKIDINTAENSAIYDDYAKLCQASNVKKWSEDDKPLQNGYSMFTHERLYRMTGSDYSEVNFTVIPTPKYSVEEPYRTASYDGVPVIGVESSLEPENYDLIGAFLEAFAAAGKKYVTEGFFEQGLRGKYSQNEASYKCLGVIRLAGWIDFVYAWANYMDSYYAFIDTYALTGVTSLSVVAANVQSSAQKKLDGLYTALTKAAKAASGS